LERAPRGESCRKDCPTPKVLPVPMQRLCVQKRYQSSLSKLSMEGDWARREKEMQAIGLASQSNR
jgi:hypothetical protein